MVTLYPHEWALDLDETSSMYILYKLGPETW